MALTAPTVEEIAEFSGRAETSYTSFINSAITQAVLMFRYSTCLTDMPEDSYDYQLALNGIMAMADSIYLSQPYDAINASPIVSQTIGSTSFTRATYGKFMERIKAGQDTGVFWFDLAVQNLGVCETDAVTSHSWSLFERELDRVVDTEGTGYVLGPKDVDPPSGLFQVSQPGRSPF